MSAQPVDDTAAEAWLARLETLRRSVDLRLDAEGNWFHEGEPFHHAGLIAAFDRGLDIHPESGESILRLGGRWCYIASDGTPFVARRVMLDEHGLRAHLNTGVLIEVGEDALFVERDRVHIAMGEGRQARLSRAAQAGLAEWLVDSEHGMAVESGDRRWPIADGAT